MKKSWSDEKVIVAGVYTKSQRNNGVMMGKVCDHRGFGGHRIEVSLWGECGNAARYVSCRHRILSEPSDRDIIQWSMHIDTAKYNS
jgi:hypothetical protein